MKPSWLKLFWGTPALETKIILNFFKAFSWTAITPTVSPANLFLPTVSTAVTKMDNKLVGKQKWITKMGHYKFDFTNREPRSDKNG